MRTWDMISDPEACPLCSRASNNADDSTEVGKLQVRNLIISQYLRSKHQSVKTRGSTNDRRYIPGVCKRAHLACVPSPDQWNVEHLEVSDQYHSFPAER
jgi:hypothetical protein